MRRFQPHAGWLGKAVWASAERRAKGSITRRPCTAQGYLKAVGGAGQRPLLVILADMAANGTFAHPNGYYELLAFNLATNRSLNGSTRSRFCQTC